MAVAFWGGIIALSSSASAKKGTEAHGSLLYAVVVYEGTPARVDPLFIETSVYCEETVPRAAGPS